MLNNSDLLAISHKLVKHEEAIHRIENTMTTKDEINKIMDSSLLYSVIDELLEHENYIF